MTNGRRRRGEPALPPKFIKIIMDPLADSLKIPASFRQRHGKTLPNRVFLKVPSGSISEVELIQTDGEIWLHKGWAQFKERYSIGFGHSLVFTYDGKSQFDVFIFDITASEIEYPFDSDSDDSVAVLEEIAPNKKEKGEIKIQEENQQQNKGKRRHCDEKIEFSDEYPMKQRGVSKEKSIAYQKAIAFMSDQTDGNPFFIRLMHQSYVSHRFSLNMPRSFVRGIFHCDSSTDFTLESPNGRAWWSVRCNIRGRYAKLTVGWKKFVQDNDLKVGDACIFEVVDRAKFVFKVTTCRC